MATHIVVDIINIITVIVFGVEHRFDDGFTYGQAFWSTLCSTAISSFTNILLITDFVRTPEFAKRGQSVIWDAPRGWLTDTLRLQAVA